MRTLCLFALFCLFAAGSAQVANDTILKVGFVYGNLPNDLSWTYSNDLGRAFLEFSRPNVKTKYVVTPFGCGPNSTNAIRSLAEKDFTLIVTSSSSFEACTKQVAQEFPNKFFLSLGGSGHTANYAAAFGRLYEARYANGIIAGQITKTKRIGFIGSIPIYQDFSDANAAILGIRSVCADCQMFHYYCGDFYLPAEDAYAAEQLITVHNVDVLFVLHDAFTHLDVAKKYGVAAFGVDSDQASVAPDTIITSAYWVWGPMLLHYVDGIRAGKWPNEFIYWGIRENGVGVSSIENVNSTVAASSLAALNSLSVNEMSNGTSFVFCGPAWQAAINGLNASIPQCLTENDILNMDYFVNGITALGFVKIPAPKVIIHYIRWESAGSIVVMVLAGLGALFCIASFVIFLIYHDSAVVKMTNLIYAAVVTLGLLLGYAMVYTYPGKLTDGSCALRPWLGGLSFAVVFAPMISKNYRLARILSNTALISTVIPLTELLLVSGGLIAIEILILVLWTAISPTRLESLAHLKTATSAFLICRSDKQWAFLGIQLAYIICVLLAGFVLSFITRKVSRRVMFREAKWINYMFFNAAVWFLLWALGTGFLWDNYSGLFAVSEIAILLLATTTAALLYGPKLYILFFVKGGRESTSTNTHGTSDFSTNFKPDETGQDF